MGWRPPAPRRARCLLLLLLLAGGAAPWGAQRGAGERGGTARYEAVKKQLGAVGAVSKQYWQYLACKVWQEGCEQEKEEESSPSPGWGLPLVGQDYLEILSGWYCSFGRCCETGDCRIVNNITGLEAELSGQLHGQHLAKEAVVRALRVFLQSPRPGKPLVLSFHGWSGTGKNFVARLVTRHLYRDGLKSECVRVFIALFHFPHHTYVDSYKAQLKKQISEIVQHCKQPLFIFDEAEKLHFSLLDAIKPFMAHYNDKDQVDYSRSIFLFLRWVFSSPCLVVPRDIAVPVAELCLCPMHVELTTFQSDLRVPPREPQGRGQEGRAAICTELTFCPTWQATRIVEVDSSPFVPSRAEQDALNCSSV
ncbi:torsin-3A isoform X2 [Colius striatus]|uniref:torsin-3A isoform X2 n=1 Tax=Colius striatus TaxID=57412 RepID=UPI002B1E161C|nr:torsin-3A isoform X2 [Colius striatus]